MGERAGTALQERRNQDEDKKEEKVTHKKSLSPVPVCRHLKPESGETSWDSTGQNRICMTQKRCNATYFHVSSQKFGAFVAIARLGGFIGGFTNRHFLVRDNDGGVRAIQIFGRYGGIGVTGQPIHIFLPEAESIRSVVKWIPDNESYAWGHSDSSLRI